MTVTYSDFDMSDVSVFSLGSGNRNIFLACKIFVLYGWKFSNIHSAHDLSQNSAEVSL